VSRRQSSILAQIARYLAGHLVCRSAHRLRLLRRLPVFRREIDVLLAERLAAGIAGALGHDVAVEVRCILPFGGSTASSRRAGQRGDG